MDNRRLCRKGGGKMLSVCQIKLPVTHTREDLEKKLLSVLRIPREELLFWRIARQSLDARKKPDLFFVYTLEASVKNTFKKCKSAGCKKIQLSLCTKGFFLPSGYCRQRPGGAFLRLLSGKGRIKAPASGTGRRRGQP